MLEAAKITGLFWVAMILTYGIIAIVLIVARRVLRMLRRPGGRR
jgi:hypothetical protein